jgi:hypothetical protein
MRKIQMLSAVAMTACLVVPFSVFAQKDDGNTITVDKLRKRVPDDLLRSAARILFAHDIKAGQLSEEKAFSYYKCASERYQDTIDDDTLRAALEGLAVIGRHHQAGTTPSAAEKARITQAAEKAGKVQIEAENACRKSLGISGIMGKAFPNAGQPPPFPDAK